LFGSYSGSQFFLSLVSYHQFFEFARLWHRLPSVCLSEAMTPVMDRRLTPAKIVSLSFACPALDGSKGNFGQVVITSVSRQFQAR